MNFRQADESEDSVDGAMTIPSGLGLTPLPSWFLRLTYRTVNWRAVQLRRCNRRQNAAEWAGEWAAFSHFFFHFAIGGEVNAVKLKLASSSAGPEADRDAVNQK